MFAEGNLINLIFLLVISALVLYFAMISEKGNIPEIRRLPQLDAIDEAIGRCTEMGKPIHFSAGTGKLFSDLAAQTISGFNVLEYVAKNSARRRTKLIVTTGVADNYPVLADILSTTYASENMQELYQPDTLRFLGGFFPGIIGICDVLAQENTGANILIGAFSSFHVECLETASTLGQISIFGSARTGCFSIMAFADYNLLGEEIFAAGAYLSKDPTQIGSIIGQDGGKIITLALLVLGALLKIAGFDIVSLLKM